MMASRSGMVWMSLCVVALAGCAAGEDNSEVVTSQEAALPSCPATSPADAPRTVEAETTNGPRGENGRPTPSGPADTTARERQQNASGTASSDCDRAANAPAPRAEATSSSSSSGG